MNQADTIITNAHVFTANVFTADDFTAVFATANFTATVFTTTVFTTIQPFAEADKGQQKAGMLANITSRSQDVATTPFAELANVNATLTMVGGEIVYAA